MYSLQLKDMNIGHDGQDVLFVYKAHRLLGPDAVGWFDSIEDAEAADPVIRRSVRTRVKDISIDKDTLAEFTKQIKKESDRKAKAKANANANQKNKRPPSSSSDEPQRKKTSGATEQEETSCAIEQETSAAAPTPESSANTPAEAAAFATATQVSRDMCTVTYSLGGMQGTISEEVGSKMHQMLLEHCNVPSGREERVSVEEVDSQISVPVQAVPGSAELNEEMEVEESDPDTPIQQSENERKEYTIG